MSDGGASPERTRSRVGRILYWLAVTAVSLVLVVGLLLFVESCDESSVRSEATAALG
jgi:hypothetical protein